MAAIDEQGRVRPIIGIVPKHVSSANIPKCVSAVSSLVMADNYVQAVIAAGGAPVVLPLTDDTHVYESLFPLVDGFLLTGGQDISPQRYGGDASYEKLSDLTPEREEAECLILSYAYRYDVPVLGICRGMQVMNVFFGGTLYLDLADQFACKDDGAPERDAVKHWQDVDYSKPTHFVSIVRASKLGSILRADSVAANSMHHQGVRDLASALDAAAYGPDGLIEAVEVRDRTFMVGVQWHPELLAESKRMGCIFSSLVCEAESYHERKTAEEGGLRIECKDEGGPWPVVRFADYI